MTKATHTLTEWSREIESLDRCCEVDFNDGREESFDDFFCEDDKLYCSYTRVFVTGDSKTETKVFDLTEVREIRVFERTTRVHTFRPSDYSSQGGSE